MSTLLEEKAAEVVAEMISLGAVLETSHVDGRAVWSWEARPAIMRNAIVHYLDGIAETDYVGFSEAMVSAILRAARQEALS